MVIVVIRDKKGFWDKEKGHVSLEIPKLIKDMILPLKMMV